MSFLARREAVGVIRPQAAALLPATRPRRGRACVVVGRAQQVLDIFLLGNHVLMLSQCESERKS